MRAICSENETRCSEVFKELKDRKGVRYVVPSINRAVISQMQEPVRQNRQSNSMRGLVSNIERFAIHDGPGIRTLVFMKGCPLRCLWCSSPQTQNLFPEILHDAARCQRCGRCIEACAPRAIALLQDGRMKIHRKLCTSCGRCVEACPNQAFELVGRDITVEQLLNEVTRDSQYFRRSNGGVTVGGGEPTMQYEFVTAFLKSLKQLYVHTAIETCGYVNSKHLRTLLDFVDLVYFDIKHMDATVHKKAAGVSNKRILENARLLSASHSMILRIPIVPGYNDSEENIRASARLATELGENLQRVELLAYHKFGVHTYRSLGRAYAVDNLESPAQSEMLRLKKIIESYGVKAQIGG